MSVLDEGWGDDPFENITESDVEDAVDDLDQVILLMKKLTALVQACSVDETISDVVRIIVNHHFLVLASFLEYGSA